MRLERLDAKLADGRFAEEQLHQSRVGLRRLRSALRFFDGLTAPIDPAWDERLAVLSRQLGASRDRDALAETRLPELRATS